MKVGLDRLSSLRGLVARLRAQRVGVLAHAASVTRELGHIADVLASLGVRPAVLFGPEHGWDSEAQDMIGVGAAVERRTGAPIVSLYGDRFEDLSPRPEHLAAIDVLLVDLVDVGSRYYTFVWTAWLALKAAARAGVPTIVLDRPNPIGGVRIEGRTQERSHLSFVGLEPVPIRHALTPGELVAYLAIEHGIDVGETGALSVVATEGWKRDALADSWDRPFVPPSPNMPTAETALVYPGGCLVEGTNLSEGRGTTRPFEMIGAPWLDGRRLAADLMANGLPGFIARPVSFRPTFQKHAGADCGGVQIHVVDRAHFEPVATYTALIGLARQQDPERFRFRTERYEYVDDIPAFDLLTGSSAARTALEADERPIDVARHVAAPDPTWPETLAAAAQSLDRARL